MKIIIYKDEKFMTVHYDIILTKNEIVTSLIKPQKSNKQSDILLYLSKIAKELEEKPL